MGGFTNNRNYFRTGLEAAKSNIKKVADSMSVRASFLVHMKHFFVLSSPGERGWEALWVSYKNIDPHSGAMKEI